MRRRFLASHSASNKSRSELKPPDAVKNCFVSRSCVRISSSQSDTLSFVICSVINCGVFAAHKSIGGIMKSADPLFCGARESGETMGPIWGPRLTAVAPPPSLSYPSETYLERNK